MSKTRKKTKKGGSRKSVRKSIIKSALMRQFNDGHEDLADHIANITINTENIEERIKKRYGKRMLIYNIKNLCLNRIFQFFKSMNEVKVLLIDRHISRDPNVQTIKTNIYEPLFSKYATKIELMRSANSRQVIYDNYEAPPSVKDREFDKFLHQFAVHELIHIFKILHAYIMGGELGLDEDIDNWIILNYSTNNTASGKITKKLRKKRYTHNKRNLKTEKKLKKIKSKKFKI